MRQETETKTSLPQFVEVKRAIIYARVSGDDTRKEGRNVKGQLEMGRKFAAEKGYRIIDELAEDERKNTSGADMNLPQLSRIIDMAQAGQFDVLIVRELDRFARSLAKQLVIEQQLKRAGVVIEYVMGEYPDTPEGQLNKQIKAVIAEYERSKTAQRMVRGKNQIAKAGKVIPCDRILYGYKYNSERTNFEIVLDEAKVIQDIFEWYNVEKLGTYKIAQRLTTARILTAADKHKRIRKKRGVGEWSASTVAKILKQWAYTGVWTFNKDSQSEEITVKVPAIISQEIFHQTEIRLAKNKKYYRKETRFPFLLNRRCRCGLCNQKMASQGLNGGKNLYYLCRAMRKGDKPHHCDHDKMFDARKVDEIIWQWVRALIHDDNTLNVAIQEAQEEQSHLIKPLTNRQNIVEDLLTQHRTEKERLLDLYLSGEFEKNLLLERKNRLEKTIESLEQERTEVLTELNGKQFLTDEMAQNIKDFARNIRAGLLKADNDLQLRREAMDVFSVEAILTKEDGQQVIYGKCIFFTKSKYITIVPDILLSGVVWYSRHIFQI